MKDFTQFVVRNVTKEFAGKTALSDFSLTISHGEFVTFLGPSGCGKSTALNCVAGLLPITRGEISIDGDPIDDGRKKVPPEKRGFGMVFQNYALFPHLSVFGNVAFGLHIRKLPKATVRDRVLAALRLVHLEGHEGRFPAQLSGGSSSGSPSPDASCWSLGSSCWTSPCPTWTQSSAWRCATSSWRFTRA